MANSPKFRPEIRGALVERFAAGCSISDAASAVGVNEKTLKGWLTRGRKEAEGAHAEFAREVDRIREEVRNRPNPMDGDELAAVVSEAARKGNTQAMKLRWEMLTAERELVEEPKEPADPLATIDELAARRAARA